MGAPAPGRAATPSHTELARRAYVAPEDTDAVDAAELQRRLNPADAVILDVRPGSQYAGGHLSGALHIPLEELTDRLAELPRDDDIIACCRGRYCVLAPDAVRLITARGRTARRPADRVLE